MNKIPKQQDKFLIHFLTKCQSYFLQWFFLQGVMKEQSLPAISKVSWLGIPGAGLTHNEISHLQAFCRLQLAPSLAQLKCLCHLLTVLMNPSNLFLVFFSLKGQTATGMRRARGNASFVLKSLREEFVSMSHAEGGKGKWNTATKNIHP